MYLQGFSKKSTSTMYKKYLCLVPLLLFSNLFFSQSLKERCNNLFDSQAYSDALKCYMHDYKLGDTTLTREIALCYKHLHDLDNAYVWYGKLIADTSQEIQSEDVFYYSELLISKGKYDEAVDWLNKYVLENETASDIEEIKEYTQEEYWEKLKEDSAKYVIEKLNINSKYSDVYLRYINDTTVVFTSNRKNNMFPKIDKWSDLPYYNLYSAYVIDSSKHNFSEPTIFYHEKFHSGFATFTKDGKEMFFSKSLKTNAKHTLNIFSSNYSDGQWSEAIQFPHTDEDHTILHPALSEDGKYLYFSSDKEGGYGGFDIYVSKRNSGGQWSVPKNLGDKVNTPGNEVFPSIQSSELLFFSSDRHLGLGGLDIFGAKMSDHGKVLVVKNTGYPINSNLDDFSVKFNEDLTEGYFSSNRTGGEGKDDLYFVKIAQPSLFPLNIEGIIYDSLENVMDEAIIALYDTAGNLLYKTVTNDDGQYNITREVESKDLVLISRKKNYKTKVIPIQISPSKFAYTQNISMGLDTIIPTKVEGEKFTASVLTDTTNKEIMTDHLKEKIHELTTTDSIVDHFKIPNVIYAYNKAEISDVHEEKFHQASDFMKKYPNMILTMSSHADSRGSKEYNTKLSYRRSLVALKYLLKIGIPNDRIKIKWHGEDSLLNDCIDGVDCDEKQHEINRRTEFHFERK